MQKRRAFIFTTINEKVQHHLLHYKKQKVMLSKPQMLLETPRFTQRHSFAMFFSTKHLFQEAAVQIILEYTYLNSNLFFKYQSQLLNTHMIYQILSSINQPGNCHQKLSQHHFSGRLQKQNFLFLEQVQVSEKKDLFSRKQATLKASVSSQIQYRELQFVMGLF